MDLNNPGIYIHIPFCMAKCHYCDFNSFSNREHLIRPYFEALTEEIHLSTGLQESNNQYKYIPHKSTINSIFIGGGTPSFVEAGYIKKLLHVCRECFDIPADAEITMEANPGTLTPDKLRSYTSVGVNRLSIGLQACQNNLLKKLGRIHTREVFEDNYHAARESGFENINIDLMFGLPGQTQEDWIETLNYIVGLRPEHISCYGLKIEEGTVFAALQDEGKLSTVSDELDRLMYHSAISVLGSRGYIHYEISNFALEGKQCRQNTLYWRTGKYRGFGAGAHSYIDDMRYNNAEDIEEYISCIQKGILPVTGVIPISSEDKISEYIILGLRMIDGISIEEFKRKFEKDIFEIYGEQLEKLKKKELIKIQGDRIMLEQIGLDLANQVFIEFI